MFRISSEYSNFEVHGVFQSLLCPRYTFIHVRYNCHYNVHFCTPNVAEFPVGVVSPHLAGRGLAALMRVLVSCIVRRAFVHAIYCAGSGVRDILQMTIAFLFGPMSLISCMPMRPIASDVFQFAVAKGSPM